MNRTYVIYHHPCTDGFGAAFAAWLALGDTDETGQKIRYVPGTFNAPPEVEEGAKVYALDLSWPAEETDKLAEKASELLVIDHHVSAVNRIGGKPYAHIDQSKSGAVLAWEHFMGTDTEVPLFFKRIQDRDLWQWQIPFNEEFTMALASYPFDFGVWHSLYQDVGIQRLINEGRVLVRQRDHIIDNLLTPNNILSLEYLHFDYDSIELNSVANFPAINAIHFYASEIGHRLLEMFPDAPFAGVYQHVGHNKFRFSLRSEDHRMDVSQVAEAFGGGGHRNASGLTLNTEVGYLGYSAVGSRDSFRFNLNPYGNDTTT